VKDLSAGVNCGRHRCHLEHLADGYDRPRYTSPARERPARKRSSTRPEQRHFCVSAAEMGKSAINVQPGPFPLRTIDLSIGIDARVASLQELANACRAARVGGEPGETAAEKDAATSVFHSLEAFSAAVFSL